jgi:hypothetical protein
MGQVGGGYDRIHTIRRRGCEERLSEHVLGLKDGVIVVIRKYLARAVKQYSPTKGIDDGLYGFLRET